jgi:streptogramin lyase
MRMNALRSTVASAIFALFSSSALGLLLGGKASAATIVMPPPLSVLHHGVGQRWVRPDQRFVRYYPVTGIDGDLFDITTGPDGALWFTETGSEAIGRLDTQGNVSKYPISPSLGEPIAITSGPDGNVWFTLGGGSQQGIGRITPSGVITTFAFGQPFSTELDITSGPDGNLWFTDFYNNMVGRVTTQGVVTEFPLPDYGAPLGITLGPDHKLWICEEGALHGNDNVPARIYKMTTALKFKAYVLSPMDWTTSPQFITVGADKNLWFTEADRSNPPFHVERITTKGAITNFPLPASAEPPFRTTLASDHNVWFTETLTYIDRVTPDGTISRLPMPQPPGTSLPAQPRGIASGPKRGIWWVETSSGSIGLLKP